MEQILEKGKLIGLNTEYFEQSSLFKLGRFFFKISTALTQNSFL